MKLSSKKLFLCKAILAMNKFRKVKAYIFDFGNVIINLNYQLMYGKFREYLGHEYESTMQGLKESKFIQTVESGVYTADNMADLINIHGAKMTTEQVLEAWNALLQNIPNERIMLLERLSRQYPIYLLSNTNLVHIEEIFSSLMFQYGYNPIKNCFDKLYLSYEMGHIKPDKKIYQYVVEDANLNPNECLFFDDLQENLDGAASIGIQTQLITKDYTIVDYFSDNPFQYIEEAEAAE